jgi:hypothetical protein
MVEQRKTKIIIKNELGQIFHEHSCKENENASEAILETFKEVEGRERNCHRIQIKTDVPDTYHVMNNDLETE